MAMKTLIRLGLIFSLMLNVTFVKAQFTQNLVYPDFIIEEVNNSTVESTDWEYAQVLMRISERNSQFVIALLEQKLDDVITKQILQMKQTRDWAKTDDGTNKCFVESESGEEYILTMNINESSGSNELVLEKMDNDYKLRLSNSKKYHDENIMFLGSDGLSGYMYNFLYHNTLKTYKQNIGLEDLSFYYTSHNTILEDRGEEQSLVYPIEDYYSSLLTYIDLSSYVSFSDGVYTFNSNFNGKELSRYDDDIQQDMNSSDFSRIKYSWFVPDNVEILSYEASKPGEWLASQRGITFTAEEGISDFNFTISYRLKNVAAKEIEKTKVELKESFSLKSEKVQVSIWDDNVEDGDIISLSLNGEWIVRNLQVKKCKATFFLDLNEEENYLIMKAENIGTQPPNTAAFLFETDNYKKHIVLNSDMGKSEMINIQVEK